MANPRCVNLISSVQKNQMTNKIIIIAGGTGNLGGRIIKELLKKEVEVRVLVRSSSSQDKIAELEQLGAKIFTVDMNSEKEIGEVCKGASCVVSALA